MKQSKRIVAALLALMLIVGILPLSAGAQETLPPNVRELVPDNIQELVPSKVDLEDLHPLAQTAETAVKAEPQEEQSKTLKVDISGASVSIQNEVFYGIPIEPEPDVFINHNRLTLGADYVVIYENNVNVGTATARIVGIGDYYGSVTTDFEIALEDSGTNLTGAYNGSATGELNDEVYYAESLVCPGVFTASIDSAAYHIAYYALYQLQGEEPVLITEYESEYGRYDATYFTYDFSDVYNKNSENGYEVYLLAYTWMDQNYDVYSGIYAMYISNKVPEATSTTMGQVIDDGDFRRDYLAVFGDDGVLNDVTWSSSNEAVAAVDDGVVTLKKPGTVTVTATAGDLSMSHDITVTALALEDAQIASYDAKTGTASIVYDRQELIARTDYTLSAETSDGVTDVTATGKGLFEGQIMQQYDAATGEAIGHTHTFDSACDATCGGCDFTRETSHQYGTSWTKDMDGHWHACTVCGDKADYAEHTLSDEDDTLCTVCGTLYIPGDLNQDFTVNEDDAIYLLQHVLLPDYFPVEQSVDYTGDGQINEDDAIYLLQHVLLPEYFPL